MFNYLLLLLCLIVISKSEDEFQSNVIELNFRF